MIEQIGIEKSKKSANESDVVIAVFDNSKKLEEQDKEILNIIKDKRAIVVLNKIDLKEQKQDVLTEEQVTGKKIVKISAKNDIGIEKIYKELVNMFNLSEIESDNNILITNVRHQDLISKAIVAINESIEEIKRMEPIDIISIKIKEILENLGEITGNNVSEDLIKSIFSKFCLGK